MKLVVCTGINARSGAGRVEVVQLRVAYSQADNAAANAAVAAAADSEEEPEDAQVDKARPSASSLRREQKSKQRGSVMEELIGQHLEGSDSEEEDVRVEAVGMVVRGNVSRRLCVSSLVHLCAEKEE